jgi:hypothetical protein
MIENGASERIKSSALATLANHRNAKRKSRRLQALTAIAIVWVFGSFGFWIVGKFPNAIAQSEGNKVTASAAKDSSQPKLLRINLTLSDPKDLKVKQGDFLQVDQIISDREDERKRLQSQRGEYLNTIKILSLEPQKPIEPLAVRKAPELPPQSFAEYESEVDFQRLKVDRAKELVSLQQRKIDLIGTLNTKDLPEGVEAHEGQQLAKIKSDLAKEEAVLQLQLGKFETAKANRGLREYDAEESKVRAALEANRTQMEYQKALADFDKSQQERQFRLADLRSKVAEVDSKLQEISTVRAQYPSEVKRIRYVKQTNNQIDVELLLYISDRTDKRIKPNSSQTLQPFTKSSN